MTNKGQQALTRVNRGQWGSTRANRSQHVPSRVNKGHQGSPSVKKGQQRTTRDNQSQQPRSIMVIQVNEGQQWSPRFITVHKESTKETKGKRQQGSQIKHHIQPTDWQTDWHGQLQNCSMQLKSSNTLIAIYFNLDTPFPPPVPAKLTIVML